MPAYLSAAEECKVAKLTSWGPGETRGPTQGMRSQQRTPAHTRKPVQADRTAHIGLMCLCRTCMVVTIGMQHWLVLTCINTCHWAKMIFSCIKPMRHHSIATVAASSNLLGAIPLVMAHITIQRQVQTQNWQPHLYKRKPCNGKPSNSRRCQQLHQEVLPTADHKRQQHLQQHCSLLPPAHSTPCCSSTFKAHPCCCSPL